VIFDYKLFRFKFKKYYNSNHFKAKFREFQNYKKQTRMIYLFSNKKADDDTSQIKVWVKIFTILNLKNEF
jgi:hypothetical protein